MRKALTVLFVATLFTATSFAQIDTLRLSTAFTTHVIFSTDLTYADLSNSKVVAAKIIEQNRNMLALKARCPFDEPTSVSALESNGKMHTYIVLYDAAPSELVIDTRKTLEEPRTASKPQRIGGNQVSLTGKSDAPLLSDVINLRQRLYHLGAKAYEITAQCENIISYSDITYVVLSLQNRSGISYDIEDATFVIESKKKGKRTVVFEKTLFPRSRYGNLSAAAGSSGKIAYSFDKMTLSKDQVLKVYLYESSGQRNLTITMDTNDINKAQKR